MKATVVVIISVLLVVVSTMGIQAQEQITISDSAGREVTIELPLERVVVLTSPVAEIMRSLDVADSIVGISGSIANNAEFWPELNKVDVVGSSAVREPDYEKLIMLAPQLVITYGTHPVVNIDEIANNLAPAGIPVLGIDGYKFATVLSDIEKLGAVFQASDKASELINFFTEIEDLASDLSASAGDEKNVYVETHANEFRGFGVGSEWHEMLNIVNAKNVLGDMERSHMDVDPELIIQRNPSVVIKDAPRSLAIGYQVEDTQHLEAYIEDFYNRVGWNQLQATADESIFVISRDLGTGPGKIICLLYLGKIFYPDAFVNVDPEEYLKEYYEKYQGIPLEGIFIYPEVSHARLP